jgi:hypothetical protein
VIYLYACPESHPTTPKSIALSSSRRLLLPIRQGQFIAPQEEKGKNILKIACLGDTLGEQKFKDVPCQQQTAI